MLSPTRPEFDAIHEAILLIWKGASSVINQRPISTIAPNQTCQDLQPGNVAEAREMGVN
jgi:hypothetical protein